LKESIKRNKYSRKKGKQKWKRLGKKEVYKKDRIRMTSSVYYKGFFNEMFMYRKIKEKSSKEKKKKKIISK
jgi:hypothetical protein